jgi:1-acyl-sn-glycerol-3-phosphate acyltransferase
MLISNPVDLNQVLPTDGIALRPREIPRLVVWGARGMLRLLGWRLAGQFPDYPKAVVIGYPHTSNIDGFIMLLTAWAYGVKPLWMVKIEMMRGPLGTIIRLLGGMAIDRRASHDTVQQAAQQIQAAERAILVISPEGTRRKTDHWKVGFYWIAHSAGVPVLCSFLDYKHHRVGMGPSFMPTGNIQQDLEPIFEFYQQMTGRNPERMGTLRLRPGQQKDAASS